MIRSSRFNGTLNCDNKRMIMYFNEQLASKKEEYSIHYPVSGQRKPQFHHFEEYCWCNYRVRG